MRSTTLLTAAFVLLGANAAMAQPVAPPPPDGTTTTTTTTWSDADGTALTQYSTTQNYPGMTDTTIAPTVGTVLPGTVTYYPLPTTVTVANPTMYEYAIINGHPVVVERTTRRVVHYRQ